MYVAYINFPIAPVMLTFCHMCMNKFNMVHNVVNSPSLRVVIRGTSSKKSQRNFVPSTHTGTHEFLLFFHQEGYPNV